MSNDDRQYMALMFEQMQDELKSIHELVADQPSRREFSDLRQDITELKEDVKTIKVAVAATNHDVADLQTRVTRLEASA